MNTRALLVLAWMAGSGPFLGCAEGKGGNENPVTAHRDAVPDSIRDELLQLGVEDQNVRQDFSPERMQDTVWALAMLRGDSARTLRLRAIVEEYGWPDSSRVGAEAAQAAFLILQHSPVLEFQKEMLPVIEDQAERGGVPRGEAALLIDRVLMYVGRPQRYGTQFRMEEGQWVLYPVEDEEGLEDRRQAMGLPPMDEYIRIMEEVYRAPIVRQP